MSAKATEMEARRSLLERAAVAVGEAWARGWLDELLLEGRSPSGGWPGTISQARARVRASFARELAQARLAAAEVPELEDGVRAAYARAREVWLMSARADEEGGE